MDNPTLDTFNIEASNVYPRSKAEEIAAALSSDPEDDWGYTVEDVSKGYSVIRVTDENGDFVAYAKF